MNVTGVEMCKSLTHVLPRLYKGVEVWLDSWWEGDSIAKSWHLLRWMNEASLKTEKHVEHTYEREPHDETSLGELRQIYFAVAQNLIVCHTRFW